MGQISVSDQYLIMKNPFLPLFILLLSSGVLRAQQALLGVKVAGNYSTFSLKDFADGSSATYRPGFAAGVFARFPVTEKFSLQPELLYSRMGGKLKAPAVSADPIDQQLTYISVPVLAQIQLYQRIRFIAGPQFDFLSSAKTNVGKLSSSGKEELETMDVALTGGIQYQVSPALQVSARYMHGMRVIPRDRVDGSYYNRGFQLAIGWHFKAKEHVGPVHPVKIPVVVPPADTDGDGIVDTLDHCPALAGLARYDGCPIPDRDSDGVNDEMDKCPDVVGKTAYAGCPVPDTDHDGINNENDNCPDVAGVAKYNGCPVPDSDHDGIDDEHDKCPQEAGIEKLGGCPVRDRDNDAVPDEVDVCPDVPGTKANKGCPVIESIEFNSKKIEFLFGSVTLTPASREALDAGAKVLNSEKFLKLKIEIGGYTDNTGRPEANLIISQRRAEAVKEYLVNRGVSAERITAVGYGSRNPIASNKTEAGRSKNRRVEFRVTQ